MPRNEGSTWNMELTILFYSEGKLISQIDHNLDQSQYSATSKRRSELYGQVIDIEVKFRRLQGLGIKPLRDYQVPTLATDVALCVEGKKFHVSKGALASESPYFEFLFYGPFVEKNQSEELIEHVSAETMTALLDVVDGQFYWPPGKEALSDLLNAADRFIVAKVTKKVEDLCINFEDYGSLNRAEMFQLAETYNMNILKAILEVKSEQETLEPLERNEQNDSYGYSDDNIGDSYGYSDDNIGIDDWFRDDYRGELEAYDPWD